MSFDSLNEFSDNNLNVAEQENLLDTDEKKILFVSENGELSKIKKLLEKNPALVNITDEEAYTPLHRACYGNHVEAVKLLLQKGANIAAKTDELWEPLHSCCRWDNVEVAQILIAEGADVNALSKGGQTPLHIAASNGNCYDIVQLLLMNPYINSFVKNNAGETAFDIARRSSKFRNIFDMVDPLLDIATERTT